MNTNMTNKTKEITTEDKVLIALKLMPVNLVERFALECSSRASAYAAKASNYYTDLAASDTASYAAKVSAAHAAADTASYAASYAALTASLASIVQGASDTLTAAHAAADLASAEEQDLQLKSIAQLIEESK